ncbi:MAG: serine/threonine-protein phosphatase [Actinobacteria bacterium]|nr:serine/threonine-protein phosphatase [Actinomycetota bacterium]MCA1720555.1 serine/threonine-protein phosphatase [Actinomycetota bacterium]
MTSQLPPSAGADRTEAYAAALHELLEGSHLVAPDQLPELVSRSALRLGIAAVHLYLVDYEQRVLTPLPFTTGQPPQREAITVDGSIGGRCFQRVEALELDAGPDHRRLWVPLLDGVERLGVAEFVLPGTLPLDEPTRQLHRQFAHLVAELLVSNAQYTDTYQWARRRQPMTLPAEMQHTMLPPLTFGTSRVIVSGLLAPAYEVGGDAFDYALNGNIAHVAVFDAVGHGLHASLLANLAVACYRNSRRAGLPLEQTAAAIDAALADGFGPERYVTAVLGQLDVDTGLFRWVNAAHPDPLLLRGGQLVKELTCPASVPLGFGSLVGAVGYPVNEESLQPGDRLLLVTDGVDEARAEDGSFFGRARLAEFAAKELASGLPTPEVMRRLQTAILRYQTNQLQDDATTVFVEWLTGSAEAMATPRGGTLPA